jgi:hypothetical protein
MSPETYVPFPYWTITHQYRLDITSVAITPHEPRLPHKSVFIYTEYRHLEGNHGITMNEQLPSMGC